MGKANVSRQALVEAIATLEAQRGLTAKDQDLNRAVDTVLQVLRQKLAEVQAEPGDRKRHQLAVLVADLSGFTALSERMDVERVRDAINAMWRVLDDVIRSWGGQIDQHAGDSMTALFGLPNARRGDASRAVHAALAMQQELELFNERVRQAADGSSDESWAVDWPGPSMRIGVHSGLVYFARVPGIAPPSSRATAVGDTVAVARRLEKIAPAGEVLVSEAVQRQVANQFIFDHPPNTPTLQAVRDGVHIVMGERMMTAAYTPGTVAGQITRLVGRTEQMDRLELALQAAVDSLTPQLVTIAGAPGAGKSRLVYEFEGRARLLAGSPTILRAGTQGPCPDFPYALVRDLLLRRFSIRPQHSRYLIEKKLAQGLAELETGEPGNLLRPVVDSPLQTIDFLAKLLDARTAATIPVAQVLAVVTPLIRAIAAGRPVIVILEGINRADSQSLELVDRLVRDGEAGPVLVLCLATTSTASELERTLPWLAREDDVFSPMERLDIEPLSPIDSRLMATHILKSLSPPPMRLLDLIVAEARGNPLYIEAFIRLLIDRGVVAVGERWRVDMVRAEATPLPVGLPKLVEARLSQLTDLERRVLQYAAILGPLCWDTALPEIKTSADMGEIGIEAALLGLELKGYLVSDDTYSFSASRAFAFRRDTVREAAYTGVPEIERRSLHLEAAHWLIANQADVRFSAWFSVDAMIARHLAAAGDVARAHIWQQRAGLPDVVS